MTCYFLADVHTEEHGTSMNQMCDSGYEPVLQVFLYVCKAVFFTSVPQNLESESEFMRPQNGHVREFLQ